MRRFPSVLVLAIAGLIHCVVGSALPNVTMIGAGIVLVVIAMCLQKFGKDKE